MSVSAPREVFDQTRLKALIAARRDELMSGAAHSDTYSFADAASAEPTFAAPSWAADELTRLAASWGYGSSARSAWIGSMNGDYWRPPATGQDMLAVQQRQQANLVSVGGIRQVSASAASVPSQCPFGTFTEDADLHRLALK